MDKDFYPSYYALEGRHWWFLGRRKLFLRLLEERVPPARRPIDVLDFGCGTGSFLEDLDRFGRASAVDADRSAVEFCHARGRREVLHAPPGEQLPFADSWFDLVTALDVIEHIDDDVAALTELRRLCAPAARCSWRSRRSCSCGASRTRCPTITAGIRPRCCGAR